MVLKGWKKLIKGERKTSTWKHLQKPRSDQTSVLDVGLGKKQSLPTDYNGSKTQQKKQIVTQGKENHKNEVVEAGVQPRQGQLVFYVGTVGSLGTARQFNSSGIWSGHKILQLFFKPRHGCVKQG